VFSSCDFVDRSVYPGKLRRIHEVTSGGADLPGSPVIGIADPLSHLTQFVIAVERYSDGTPAPSTAKHKH
jgi:hypothetical protein